MFIENKKKSYFKFYPFLNLSDFRERLASFVPFGGIFYNENLVFDAYFRLYKVKKRLELALQC